MQMLEGSDTRITKIIIGGQEYDYKAALPGSSPGIVVDWFDNQTYVKDAIAKLIPDSLIKFISSSEWQDDSGSYKHHDLVVKMIPSVAAVTEIAFSGRGPYPYEWYSRPVEIDC
jgi:hypothetical protein